MITLGPCKLPLQLQISSPSPCPYMHPPDLSFHLPTDLAALPS
uniref:Uncharacterized protein n=1 Tax=Arundo donax TaxID=35708 RepID=A0A0A9FD65_ARUDO